MWAMVTGLNDDAKTPRRGPPNAARFTISIIGAQQCCFIKVALLGVAQSVRLRESIRKLTACATSALNQIEVMRQPCQHGCIDACKRVVAHDAETTRQAFELANRIGL